MTLAQLQDVLGEASELVAGLYRSGVRTTRKADGSLLTDADVQANEFLRRALRALLPAAAWLSEESADDRTRLEKEWVWIVDPLDGTREFASGIPEFAISVGLVRRGRLIAGGVVNPATGEGAVGGSDLGFECWGCERTDRQVDSLRAARASVSRREVEHGTVVPYLGMFGTTLPVGSIAYKLLRVATGIEDVTFSVQHKSLWDVCGGIALVEAVGRVYERLDGNPVAFDAADTRLRSGAAAGVGALVRQLMPIS